MARNAESGFAASLCTAVRRMSIVATMKRDSEFEIPDDPSTLVTAVMAATSDSAYADAIAAATDEATWDVSTFQETEVDGLPATLVEATAIADGGDVPSGTSRYAVFVDVGGSGSVSLFTTGTSGDETYETLTGVVTLMAGASTFVSGD